MKNVKLRGVVFHDGHNVETECELTDPECQSVAIEWDGGSALLNEDRLGYTTQEYADEQWAKTMAAARLMAAAPEMLAALEAFEIVINSLGWEALGGIEYNDLYSDFYPLLKQAIAKAKGGE